MATYDVVIAGGGTNGMVIQAYLQKAGLSTCIVELQPYLGGGARTSEVTLPGFKHDTLFHRTLGGLICCRVGLFVGHDAGVQLALAEAFFFELNAQLQQVDPDLDARCQELRTEKERIMLQSSGVASQESVPSLQESIVHETPSSQTTGEPASQMPALQTSAPLQ